jgi:Flp pilus assembly protein TadD
VTLVVFLPTLHGQFLTWDDRANFLTNTHYRGLGIDELRWMWTTTLLGHYVPLSWMSLGLDYLLWGMNPAGYHVTNVVLHAANAALLVAIARRLFSWNEPGDTRSEPVAIASVVAALFFSLHPLRVESVAWITERRDVLSLCFMLASVLFYLKAAREPRLGRAYAISLAAFVAALLSKATTVTLPAALLLINVYPLRRIGGAAGWKSEPARRVFRELAPFFVLSIVAGIGSVVALTPGPQLGLLEKLAVSCYGLAFYLLKTIVPYALSPLYELPPHVDPMAARFLVSSALVIAIVVVVWRTREKWPAAAAAFAAFLVMTLPLLGIVQNGPQIAADRYTYHSAAALSLLVGAVLLAWPQRATMLRAGATVVLMAFVALTWRQEGVWKNSSTLWDRVLTVDANSAIGRNGRGTELAEAGDGAGAMEEYRRSIALNPRFVDPHNNLGYELAKAGRDAEAIAEYRAALAIKSDYGEAEVNWGNVLHHEGRLAEAIEHFARAAALEPGLSGAQFNWGISLAERGDLSGAVPHLERAATLDPADPDTRAALDDVRRAMRAPH